MDLGTVGSGKLPVQKQISRCRVPRDRNTLFPFLTLMQQEEDHISFQKFWNKCHQAPHTTQIYQIQTPTFSEERDESFTLKFIHVLFKFAGRKNRILRKALAFPFPWPGRRKHRGSRCWAAAKSQGYFRLREGNQQRFRNVFIRKLLDPGQTAIIQARCLSGKSH